MYSILNACSESDLSAKGVRVNFAALLSGRMQGGVVIADLTGNDQEVDVVDLDGPSPHGLVVLKSSSRLVIHDDPKKNFYMYASSSAEKLTLGIWDTAKDGVIPTAFLFGTGSDARFSG